MISKADKAAYDKVYYKAHAEEKIAYQKSYDKEHAEEKVARSKAYRREHTEDRATYNRAYNNANPAVGAAQKAKYRAAKKQAIPSWADLNRVKEVYVRAQLLGLVVDHIVPIQSSIVCGLHCEDNLQFLTRSENSSKHNKLLPQYTEVAP